jgi:CRP-like cAMP-binding protein
MDSMEKLKPLLCALERRDGLTTADCELLAGLPLREQRFRRGQEIVLAKSRPQESGLVLDGICGREVLTPDGKRQISMLHIAGDFVDLHAFVLKQLDHAVIALTESVVLFVRHADLRRLVEASPHLGRLLWMMTAIDGAVQRAWIGCLGRSSALQQMAHLFCEMFARMEIVGLAQGPRFPFHPTQGEFADVMGLSPVHVNRTLKELRALRLVDWDGHFVEVHDFAGLAALAGFDETYLNLSQEPR